MSEDSSDRLSTSQASTSSLSTSQSSVKAPPSPECSQQAEYETQHFGFTPESFCDGVYNALVGYTQDSLNGIQKYLQTEFAGVVPSREIERGTDKLLARMEKNLDKYFEKLEVYMRSSLFRIPPHITLPEDRHHLQHAATEEDVQQLDAEIQELQSKIQSTKYLNARYRQAMVDMQKMQREYEKALEPFQALEDVCYKEGVSDYNEYSQGVNEDVQELKQALSKIKNMPPAKRSLHEEPETRRVKCRLDT